VRGGTLRAADRSGCRRRTMSQAKGKPMRRLLLIAVGAPLAWTLTLTVVRTQESPSPIVDMNAKFNSGQTVAPVFEGWEPNKDGTFSLYFGYLNRNYKEVLDIPIGPANHMEPGGDRGQPTHFLPRRQSNVFQVVVPKDFGNQKIEWTFTFRGKTEKVTASLNPLYQIDISRDTTTGNTPPVVTVERDLKTTFPAPVTLTLSATDDGLPKGGRLAVIWSQYRGPGQVTFGDARFVVNPSALGGFWGWQPEMKDGKATATATFSEPGAYVLLATVADGRFGRSCCQTVAQVRVTADAGKK
jgi:hypothetical protein